MAKAKARTASKASESSRNGHPGPASRKHDENEPPAQNSDGQAAGARDEVAGHISIRGARTHNLRNISIDIPRGQLTVVTGVSGSGKSSLVFDTLYAEGQRRYVQSLSTYARLFLERMERPDVDSISDIPPALALRQKNSIKNARSTVGSVTEINDYLRLLFATVGETFCPRCGQLVSRDTTESAEARVTSAPGMYIFIAPLRLDREKPEKTLSYLVQNGYHRVYRDGAIIETTQIASSIESLERETELMVVIDRVSVTGVETSERVREAIQKSFYVGGGKARAVLIERRETDLAELAQLIFDRRFNCTRCDIPYPEPTPALFSANSPIGACPTCEGFGRTVEIDLAKVIPNPGLSIRQGLVAPWRTPAYREMHEWMIGCAKRKRIRLTAPYREFTDEERTWLLDGESAAEQERDREAWPGVRGFFRWLEGRRYKTHVRVLLAKYRRFVECGACHGTKLKPEALNVKVGRLSIAEAGHLSMSELGKWVDDCIAESNSRAAVVLRELKNRVGYLNQVGLGYLTLERQARTLSGGEAQRIHLASALGSRLTGTLYALDEPTVGLHPRDSTRLLGVLRELRDLGNSVVVVEHDPTMIAGGDFIIELGPGGGRHGGLLTKAARRWAETGNGNGANGFQNGRVLLMRAISRERRFTRRDPAIRIWGAAEHNLKNVDVSIPLGRFVVVTGVSGSGKSTLVEQVLYNNYLSRTGGGGIPGTCKKIEGFEQIGAMIHMGQETLTRSNRSNPATYLKIYDEIRRLFAATPDAKRLKIQPRHFSFNVAGGRCEKCRGTGTVTIEMHFMADVEVSCDVCEGRRFQAHILGLNFQGRNITRVLAQTVDEASSFFSGHSKIVKPLEILVSVGLGYLQLGQATSTLSGGEAQRLKLAAFLLEDKSQTRLGDGTTPQLPRLFLLDEPTTGLSSSDIKNLLRVINRLVTEGHTVVAIEHNLEFIANGEYVIDLGPEGGDGGGKLVAAGTPLSIATNKESFTGKELRALFGLPIDGGVGALRSVMRKAAASEMSG